MFFLPLSGYADPVKIDGVWYNLYDDAKQAEITNDPNEVDIYEGDMDIPETIEYNGLIYSVTSIGQNTFNNSLITSIKIPQTIADIDLTALRACNNLVSIIVDDGNMIYDSRYNCNAIIETESNTLLFGCKTEKLLVK